ncbi:hypothetical protein RN607_00765 [Demequina capsici]|uniref:Uncharacterized protein n=1 Tax=Demequina capsici TaxID=3075620 RepID=A0AA96FDP3_9MICO|nr:hypothetical protein [Demequina sp. PMTSA13]WNM27565.1 hypothetical protein RN607_00765 [Demequina sp. PMTSA13]
MVFDANIWIDTAVILGAPATRADFDRANATTVGTPIPHPIDRAYDSMRAIATTLSGRFVADERIEVWTSNHIDDLVYDRLARPVEGAANGRTGYGWSLGDAEKYLVEMVDSLVESTAGGSVGDVSIPFKNPPLDHEDGCVMQTARTAGHSDTPWYQKYIITRDQGFRTADLSSEITVLYPWEWIGRVRGARVAGVKPKVRAR